MLHQPHCCVSSSLAPSQLPPSWPLKAAASCLRKTLGLAPTHHPWVSSGFGLLARWISASLLLQTRHTFEVTNYTPPLDRQRSEPATLCAPSPTGVGLPDPSLPYGITYNCLQSGGDRITLIGLNLGSAGARIMVNDRPCIEVVHDVPQERVSCTTPPGTPTQGYVHVSSMFTCVCCCRPRDGHCECHHCRRIHARPAGIQAIPCLCW